MEKIVYKFLSVLEKELSARKVSLSVSDSAVKWFAEHGFDKKLGARPLERVIKKHIQEEIADDLLFGRLAGGGSVKVKIQAKKLILDIKGK
jgi:ATP-dependent Clp protease ATP-binding subunit ClpA